MQAAKLGLESCHDDKYCFILGLLPLVFATGAGAASRHSVGMTVLGGMIAVAFMELFSAGILCDDRRI